MCSHPPPAPAGRYRTPSPQRTGTKQVAKKWCRCVMSNLCIIKILFEQMSQEASGLLSQAGTAKFFWPSVAEQGVSALLAPAGIAAVVREPCLPVGTEGPGVLSSLVGTWLCSRWLCVHGWGRRAAGSFALCLAPAVLVASRDTSCCCLCAAGGCREASEELEGWRVSVLGRRGAEHRGHQRVSVKQGRHWHMAPCSSAPLPHRHSPSLRTRGHNGERCSQGRYPRAKPVPSCARSCDWQSLAKLLEPNWLTTGGSGAGGCLQEPPSPCHPLQKLLRRRSDATAERFCAFGGSPLCQLHSVGLIHGE